MMQLPTALVAALREPPPEPTAARPEVASSHLRRGDLRFAGGVPGDVIEPRLVLVLSVDSRHEFADVLLVHTATEMACDIDLVVSTMISAAPYDVVVEADLRGVVWSLQLGPAVGCLDDDTISALSQNTAHSQVVGGLGVRRGIPLAGPSDPRWDFKHEEGAALRALSRDCTTALLDEEAWMVDPGLMRPNLLALADDPAALVAELMHWVKTRSLSVSTTEIELLFEAGAFDVDAWAAVDDLGLDIWTAIQELVVNSATAPGRSRADSRRLLTATHLEIYARSAEPDVVHYLGLKELAAA